MFRGGQANPYDDVVAKATDENLTGENWEVILNLCDKVQDEGEQGARNVIAALLKRMTHRSPNVQLYSLSLAESLSKNCGVELHRELASRAFTQALEKLITDRTTHDKVKRRALGLIAMWTAEFENDPTLGIMEECYNSLKAKNYKFETPNEPPPPTVDDEIRRKEEEELQRVLEMSMQDKGGRNPHSGYSAASSSGASGSGAGPSSSRNASGSQAPYQSNAPTYHSGYVPARSPSPKVQAPAVATQPVASTASASTTSVGSQGSAISIPIVTRVRALHTFEPTEPGELAFDKGDVIKVVDRGYKDWWRGQLKGRTGIFPVNYVEPLPEPTAAELAKEAEQEAAVFAQAANVDRLLTMLRTLDASTDSLADNEEIQELYRSCMSLRPKIVKLIDKYSQKRADLVSMNESFVKARTIFDRMMEDSLARHAGMYEAQPDYRRAPPSQYQPRPESRNHLDYGPVPQPQPYGYPAGYDQAGYNAYPTQTSGYQDNAYPGQPQQQPYGDPNAYGPPQPQTAYGHPYGAPPTNGPYGAMTPSPYPQQQDPQSIPQLDPSPTPHAPVQQPTQQHLQPQSLSQSPQQQSGPPYLYDPNTTYADPNVQAWAQYYAQGGKDDAGAVYFISVPGVTDHVPQVPPPGPQEHVPGAQVYQQQQPQTITSTPQGVSPASSHPPTDRYHAQAASMQSPVMEHAAYTGTQGQSPYPPQPYHQESSAPAVGSSSPPSASTAMAAAAWSQQQQQPPSPTSPSTLRRQSTAHSMAPTASGPAPYGYGPQMTSSPSQQQQQQYSPQGSHMDPAAGYGSVQQGASMHSPQGERNSPTQGWQQPAYQSLQHQFSEMEIGGQNRQSSYPGQQPPMGVGAPA
ncbi:hypothetical protein BV22DRAFT_1197529 [Leucogyrophana mollusca]|uniref:Uncharacterized protein n=1 Tax=Leucogyrophana mollusca TaxID=85980 RepID=A0ACB8B9R4_9AGAM|nr:hypothetical protein BV22DRAFT_1197529 [Leucogyrophana mollusca]